MSTPCLTNIVEINKNDCIGASRVDINNNFSILRNAICALESSQIGVEQQLIYLIPYGGIINLWGDITLGGLDFDLSGRGKINAVTGRNLTGFALCNGGNGTPDLRDRFVVAAGRSYFQGEAGPLYNSTASLEFSSVQLTIPEMPRHNHDVDDPTHKHTVVDKVHQHEYNDLYNKNQIKGVGHALFGIFTAGFVMSGKTVAEEIKGSVGAGSSNSNSNTRQSVTQPSQSFVTVENASSNVDILETGNDKRHENRPPYFGLAYVMRIEL